MSQHLYFLGIGGTLMGSLAQLAKQRGYRVSGCDNVLYPPMSDQLAAADIKVFEGFDPTQLQPAPDLVIVGNADLPRGHPGIEYVLDNELTYTSGAEWLGRDILPDRWVLAVAGTHGKTTTSSMVAWLLEEAGMEPGFLIGGVPADFGVSARLGNSSFFVVEADEYDSAFFDKRSKFVHYRPQVVTLNNLEYDHADIFPDLAAIETQFHHLIRTIPGNGTIISNAADANLERVLARGCWSKLQRFSFDDEHHWQVEMLKPDGSELRISHQQEELGVLQWNHCGRHNAMNAISAIAAAAAVGVPAATAIVALASFSGVRRRMELILKTPLEGGDVHVYDDFAHHPTAIRLTLEGLRRKVGNARILVALEPRSNTMRAGVHADELGPALLAADHVWLKTSDDIDWDPQVALAPLEGRCKIVTRVNDMLVQIQRRLKPGDHIVFMSNGGFEAAPDRLAEFLRSKGSEAG